MKRWEKLYVASTLLMLFSSVMNLRLAKRHYDAEARADRIADVHTKLSKEVQSYSYDLIERVNRCEQFILHGCTDNSIEKFMKSKNESEKLIEPE